MNVPFDVCQKRNRHLNCIYCINAYMNNIQNTESINMLLAKLDNTVAIPDVVLN